MSANGDVRRMHLCVRAGEPVAACARSHLESYRPALKPPSNRGQPKPKRWGAQAACENVPRSCSLERGAKSDVRKTRALVISGRIPSRMLALRRVSSNVALRTARAVLVSRRTIVVGRDHGNFNWVFLLSLIHI